MLHIDVTLTTNFLFCLFLCKHFDKVFGINFHFIKLFFRVYEFQVNKTDI